MRTAPKISHSISPTLAPDRLCCDSEGPPVQAGGNREEGVWSKFAQICACRSEWHTEKSTCAAAQNHRLRCHIWEDTKY